MNVTLRGFVVVVTAAAALAAVPFASAQEGSPLQGEFLFSRFDVVGTDVVIEVNCNPDDPTSGGTITGHATGFALGPYPGTFDETFSFTFGAEGTVDTTHPKFRVVTDAHASFQIDSGDTEITGTKTLATRVPREIGFISFAQCRVETGPSNEICSFRTETATAAANVTYEATIRTPTATFSDTGFANMGASRTRTDTCVEHNLGFDFESRAFNEAFILSTSNLGEGHATGGGVIRRATGEPVSFGFTAQSELGNGAPHGRCSVIDHLLDIHIQCLGVTDYVQTGNTATFSGPASVDGVATTYSIVVVDSGEPSTADTFAIVTGTGYSAAGVLDEGNVVVHEPPQ